MFAAYLPQHCINVIDITARKTNLRPAEIINFRFDGLLYAWSEPVNQDESSLSILQEMGGWESIEMVRRYAHLAPRHLSRHSQQIDVALRSDVSNMSHTTLNVVGEYKRKNPPSQRDGGFYMVPATGVELVTY